MGPKKKKVNKLAKMSEEEKLRYLQHRAAVEEEQRRRKQQLISTFMKNKLKHEEAFTRLNTAKINAQWRQLLRQIKNTELRDVAENLKQSFEAAISAKDNIILSLISNLNESEIQKSVSMQAHLEAIETLMSFHSVRLHYIKKNYLTERDELLNKATGDREHIIESSFKKTEYLNKCLKVTESESRKNLKKLNHLTLGKRFKLKFQIKGEVMRIEETGQKTIESLWIQMQQVFRQYKVFLDKIEPEYNKLKDIDNKNREDNLHKSSVIQHYTDLVKKMKRSNARTIEMYECHKEQLKEMIDDRSKYMMLLRKTLSEANAKDEQKLLLLTSFSNTAINGISVQIKKSDWFQRLEKLVKKVEIMKNMVEKCKKYYTEKEDLMPSSYWQATQLSEDPAFKAGSNELSDLDELWVRYSNAHLHVKNLRAHSASYTVENQQLKKFLKQYLNSLAIPPSFPKLK